MTKRIILFIFNILLFFSLYSQKELTNHHISVKSYFNMMDSSIYLSIENICDSVLVFNDNTEYYYKLSANYFCDLGLIGSGKNGLPPFLGEFMEYKRLLPKSTYVVVINKNYLGVKNTESFLKDIDSFILSIRVEYIVTSYYQEDFFRNHTLNRCLVEAINKNSLKTHGIWANLVFDSNNSNNCFKILKFESFISNW